jgi:hypothetical protein
MNVEGVGNHIAKIVVEGKKDRLISVTDKKEDTQYSLDDVSFSKGEKVQQIPDKEKERSILYITGASGSGKSYYTREYCEQYKKMYPKNPIYLFSSVNDDSSIDKVKGLKRFVLDDKFINEAITAEDFKNSMCIFDDTDCITNKPLRNKINGILNMLLETGRHFNTSVIYTSHVANAGLDTKKILNESHSITFFPASLGGRSLKYLLDNYLGFDKDQIKRIKAIKSRWITICKTYPMVVLYQNGAYLANCKD